MTDVVVAVSQPLRAYLARRLHLPECGIELVRNGVDVEAFVPHAASGTLRGELHLPPETIIVGSIGRLERVKGYDIVIRAFATVCQQESARRPVLVIAGEGSARAGLERLVGKLGIADRVFFLGWRDDVAELYAQFHCFVLGSWSEGTSVSLLEAMACGVAPVVTAVGGNADVLGPELAEQLATAGDVPGMAECIARVLDDNVAQQIGLRARRRVERAFNITQMVLQYQRLYADGSLSATAGA